MEYDIFFSISQTPVNGFTPSESQMFQNFLDQVCAADELGYKTAWIAESHFSSEVQKRHKNPVVPHWKGEVGLNGDIFQLSHKVFSKTRNIHMGSAVMNLICNGGPIAAAERVATFCALHGLDPQERRRLNIGFSAGRFDFISRVTGIVPRNEWEDKAWPIVKGKIFDEACEIFLRLLKGEVLESSDIIPRTLSATDFRTPQEWQEIQKLSGTSANVLPLPRRWEYEAVQIIPKDWRRELLNLVIGSHDPKIQEKVNQYLPVQVFNLSITQPEVIEDTHRRMKASYHPSGDGWKRSYMPRTVFVFLNNEAGLSPTEQRRQAQEEARGALGAYWTALEGTLDPSKVAKASDNALIGNADDITEQILERFHPEDRLMLWFDFFNHDSARVIRNMEGFMKVVASKIKARLS